MGGRGTAHSQQKKKTGAGAPAAGRDDDDPQRPAHLAPGGLICLCFASLTQPNTLAKLAHLPSHTLTPDFIPSIHHRSTTCPPPRLLPCFVARTALGTCHDHGPAALPTATAALSSWSCSSSWYLHPWPLPRSNDDGCVARTLKTRPLSCSVKPRSSSVKPRSKPPLSPP